MSFLKILPKNIIIDDLNRGLDLWKLRLETKVINILCDMETGNGSGGQEWVSVSSEFPRSSRSPWESQLWLYAFDHKVLLLGCEHFGYAKLYLFPLFQFHSLDLRSDSHWVEKNNKKRQEKEKLMPPHFPTKCFPALGRNEWWNRNFILAEFGFNTLDWNS